MIRRIAVVFVAGSCLLSVGNGAPQLAGVVVITLDTARADRLTPYGYSGVAMPAMERLASRGVVFERALSPVPLTLPSHCSIFTGLLPPHHRVHDNADEPLGAERATMAGLLHRHGFRTAAFVGAAVLDRSRGLARGFDVYSDVPQSDRQRRGDAVVDEAVRWLETAASSPFFLWTHLYDAHRPYEAPAPYATSSADPYVAELVFADAQLGRLMSALERAHVIDRTLIVVTADHGESLGEHGERDHGIFVYDNVLRVPLIIHAPGVVPRRVSDVAQLTDILPTVLDFAGLGWPAVDGVSLRAVMNGQHEPDRPAYAESLYATRFGWSALRALEDERFKYIDAPRQELYDLSRDPFEEHNIAAERPALAGVMARRLARIGDRWNGLAYSAIADTVSRGQALASLGYVSGPPPTVRGVPRDPKDCRAWVAPDYAACR